MTKDTKLFDLIESEKRRQMQGIELIASENFVSEQVMQAMGSVLTNKYAGRISRSALLRRLRGRRSGQSSWLSIACASSTEPSMPRAASFGAQAQYGRIFTVLKPGDTFMGLDLSHGGHLSHGSPVNTSGILYHAVGYKLDERTGRIDYDAMEKLALEHKPKMIIGGASAYRPASGTTSAGARSPTASARC